MARASCGMFYTGTLSVLTLKLTDLRLKGSKVLIHIVLTLGSNHISRGWGLGTIACNNNHELNESKIPLGLLVDLSVYPPQHSPSSHTVLFSTFSALQFSLSILTAFLLLQCSFITFLVLFWISFSSLSVLLQYSNSTLSALYQLLAIWSLSTSCSHYIHHWQGLMAARDHALADPDQGPQGRGSRQESPSQSFEPGIHIWKGIIYNVFFYLSLFWYNWPSHGRQGTRRGGVDEALSGKTVRGHSDGGVAGVWLGGEKC